MPKDRIEDVPAEDADADDRTGDDLPAEITEAAEPPAERQDLSEDELRELTKKKKK
jgi:hypothetical protein